MIPDPRRSRAVLIGVGGYEHLPPLPSVLNNLDGLAACLRDDELWGLPESHCTVVRNPASQDVLLDAIHDAAEAAQDCLLVYFAGHGLIDEFSGELLLGLVGSVRGKSYRAVQYEQVKRLLNLAAAPRRISILDCCYSGKAVAGMADPASAVADEMSAEGTFTLASAPANKQALAPEGEQYTAFTGALIELLRHGVRDGDEYLSLQEIYRRTTLDLTASSRPRPQMRSNNSVAGLALVRNSAWPHKRQAESHIWVSLLGTPLVNPVNGGDPGGREAELTALAALLAARPEGVPGSELDENLLAPLMNWMGPTASGEPVLVAARNAAGSMRYRFHPDVVCDWAVWQRLVDKHPFHVATERLQAALDLVRGEPFGRADSSAYGWAGQLRRDMVHAVSAVAEELGSRYIRGARAPFDLAKARTAAEVGIAVDSVNQGAWRVAIIATHFSGAADAVELTRTLIGVMHAELVRIGAEADGETVELLTRLADYEHGATYPIPGVNGRPG